MNIASANNIMDNLIADGEVADAIVVTKDNTYFNFEKGDSLKNLTECIHIFACIVNVLLLSQLSKPSHGEG